MQASVVKRLVVRRRILWGTYGAVILGYVGAIVCLVGNRSLGILLINGITLFYIFGVRRIDRSYNRCFAQANLLLGNGKQLENAALLPKDSLTWETVTDQQILPTLPSGKGVLGGIGLGGRYRDITVEYSEATICCAGNGEKAKAGVLCGIWIRLVLPKSMGSSFVLADKKSLEAGHHPGYYTEKGFVPLSAASPEVDGKYFFYGEEGCGDKTVSQFLRRSRELVSWCQRNGQELTLKMQDGTICAFLNRASLMGSAPVQGRLTADRISWNQNPELHLILKFAEQMLSEY